MAMRASAKWVLVVGVVVVTVGLPVVYFFALFLVGFGDIGPFCDIGPCTTPKYVADLHWLNLSFIVIALVWTIVAAAILWVAFRMQKLGGDRI